MRTAICGNIAGNAYALAKGLRGLGVGADSFDMGAGWVFSLPIWDEGEFDFRAQGFNNAIEIWRTSRITTDNDWRRPSWAKILGNDGKDVQPWYDTQEDFEADIDAVLLGRHTINRTEGMQRYDLLKALERSRTPEDRWEEVIEYHTLELAGGHDWRARIRTIVEGGYDLAVLCGPTATIGTLLPKEVPYITFEHSTMRDAPELRTLTQRALALAYQHADWNVITNADCWEAAGMLGVRHNASFIPHPLDEQKFTPDPGPDTDAGRATAAARAALCDWLHCELLLFAPARHCSNTAIGAKRNDRYLYAFSRYVTDAEPQGAPKAGLVLMAWGDKDDLDASRGLIEALGLTERVIWQAPQPRPRLVQFYRAADIVLDQFSDVGSFGTTTVEAMACAKPVITYYSHEVHRWCVDVFGGEQPPLRSARTVDDIYEGLVFWAMHPHERGNVGRRAREWVQKWHSLPRVANAHLALYEGVLAGKAQTAEARELVTA